MKFQIENQNVLCIPTHEFEKLSIMTIQNESTSMMLYSIFKRFRQGRSKNQKDRAGDNCPMLYALKGLDNLTISEEHKQIFYDVAVNSMIHHFGDECPFDCIILLPSSHGIARKYVELLAEYYHIKIIEHFIQKKTNQQMKQELNAFFQQQRLEDNIHRILINKLNAHADDDAFTLKTIPVPYRQWTKPFMLLPQTDTDLLDHHVLLIDDICSSGVSLLHAKELINQYYPKLTIKALTLFGKII